MSSQSKAFLEQPISHFPNTVMIGSRSDAQLRTSTTPTRTSYELSRKSPINTLTKSPIKAIPKSISDFNKQLEIEIEQSLLTVKRRTAGIKQKLETMRKAELMQENINYNQDQFRQTILKDASKQYQTQSHIIYPYASETDIDVIKSLATSLYNLFLKYESRENIFQQFRILNEEPLRNALQDKVILEKKLEDRNRAALESQGVADLMKRRLDAHESRIQQISFGVQKNLKIQDQAENLQMNLKLKDSFIEDMKRSYLAEVNDLKSYNLSIQDKNSLLMQERIAVDNTIKGLRKSNSELNSALNRANQQIQQLSQKILDLDQTNQSFLQKGQSILASFRNLQTNEDMFEDEYQIHQDQLKLVSLEKPQQFQYKSSAFKEEGTPGGINQLNDQFNYKNEFVKLCEFNLNMLALFENNTDLSPLFLKSYLSQKKEEIQSKYAAVSSFSASAQKQLESSRKSQQFQQDFPYSKPFSFKE